MHRFSGGNIPPEADIIRIEISEPGHEMHVSVLLGGHLRTEAHDGPMERIVELPEQARGLDLVSLLGLPAERVRMIFVNSRAGTLSASLRDGDRVALFPPELSYNTFVALSYRRDRIQGSK